LRYVVQEALMPSGIYGLPVEDAAAAEVDEEA
jgi:hypothetical protein